MDPADLDAFSSRRSTVYGPRGAVATSQPLAASAGVAALRDGGNAFDAAVTAAAALNVVEPTSTGLGGDVFALYRTPDDDIGAMRSCGGAPRAASIEAVRDAAETDEMPFYGPHTVTVPGTARGWEALIDRHGARSLAANLEPAITYATEGYPVTPIIADHWTAAEDLFTDVHAREAYLKNGRAPRASGLMRLPALGESLQTVAESGADPVYEGAIADAIVEEIRSKGGFMTHDDLAAFTPEFIDPVSADFHDATVYQLPPNNQGLIVLQALRIAEAIDATAAPPDSIERTHALIESMKLAFHDGHRHITDPEYVDVPDLTDDAWIEDRAARIDETAIENPELPPPGNRGEDSDTVLVTAADDEGNVVTVINSRFAGFGSGLVAGDTGIALQNRGASFSLDPDHANCLKPGKRPFHTLIPAIVRFGPDDWASFGVMGGHMQPQGQLQILARIVADDADPQRALDAPRWRHRANGRLAVEARMDDVRQQALLRRGHDVVVNRASQFGGAQIVRSTGDAIAAATEPRKDGIADAW